MTKYRLTTLLAKGSIALQGPATLNICISIEKSNSLQVFIDWLIILYRPKNARLFMWHTETRNRNETDRKILPSWKYFVLL